MVNLPAFPDSLYLTIKQVAERWECKEETIIKYNQSGMLDIGIKLKAPIEIYYVEHLNTGETKLSEDLVEFQDPGFLLIPMIYIKSLWEYQQGNQTTPLPAKRFRNVLEVDVDENGELEMMCEDYYSPNPININYDDLLIRRDIRDKFEIQHNIEISDTYRYLPDKYKNITASEREGLSTKERNTFLKIIAALVYSGYEWDGKKPHVMAKTLFEVYARKGVEVEFTERVLADKLKAACQFLP